jgi:hypothetical protein
MLARRKSMGSVSSSEELFAVKVVPHACASKVEREVLIEAAGHPFLTQMFAYFQTKVSCSFKQPMSMH